MAYNRYKGYDDDPKYDYSRELMNPNLTDAARQQLVTERQARIDDQFGGKEPNLSGSDKTFSQIYGPDGRSNYHQDAIDYAEQGSRQGAVNALGQRETKVGVTHNDYGKSSSQILDELMDEYFGGTVGGTGLPGQPVQAPYQSGYDDTYNRLAQAAQDMTYEQWLKGQQYAGLKNRYEQAGQQAMRDTSAEISARTGGLSSSYAATAANQAYLNNMNGLEDAARSAYQNDRNQMLQNAELAGSLADRDYRRYQDALSRTDQQRKQALARQDAERERADAQAKQDRANIESIAKDMAQYGDFSRLKSLGYTDDEIAQKKAAYDAAQVLASEGNYGGGTGGRTGTKKSASDTGDDTAAAVGDQYGSYYNDMLSNMPMMYDGDKDKVKQWLLRNYSLKDSEATAIANGYVNGGKARAQEQKLSDQRQTDLGDLGRMILNSAVRGNVRKGDFERELVTGLVDGEMSGEQALDVLEQAVRNNSITQQEMDEIVDTLNDTIYMLSSKRR